MTRDTAFWTMVICLFVPGLALGALRGRAVTKTYFAIYTDLKKAGIELSKPELQALIRQLHRNPRAVLDTNSVNESRRVKEQHVQALVSYLRPIRFGFVILVVVGIVSILLFQHLWPRQ